MPPYDAHTTQVRRNMYPAPDSLLSIKSRVAQLAKTGYHTRLIHFVQYFMEESVCMVSEGHVEPVDE